MKRNELRAMLLEQPYDALVLTSEISRRYATGFHSTAGAVYLSAKQAVFFTDFRYVEAAHAAIKDFEVREIKAGQSYSARINELLDEDAEVDLAGAIREYGTIVDRLKGAFEVEKEEDDD